MRLQRVVTNVPGLMVPSFVLAELKTTDVSEIRLVKQGQITAMPRFLNALGLLIITRRSARNLVSHIIIGSGASRLQGVRYRMDCCLLVSKRPCR